MKYINESIFDIDEHDLSQIDEVGDSQMKRGGSYQYIQRSFKLDFPPLELQIKRVMRERGLKSAAA
jgi:hypothetical protein